LPAPRSSSSTRRDVPRREAREPTRDHSLRRFGDTHLDERFVEHGARDDEDLGLLLANLYKLIESRERERPDGSYTTYLFNSGLDKILKKLGEESAETIIAAKNDDLTRLSAEASDLLYHLLVLLVARGVSLEEIADELGRRRKK